MLIRNVAVNVSDRKDSKPINQDVVEGGFGIYTVTIYVYRQ